jgi:type I restriction enzyme S subunit
VESTAKNAQRKLHCLLSTLWKMIHRTSPVIPCYDTESKTPKLRFPEFNGEWEEKKLSELFKINAGGDVDAQNVSSIKTDIFKYPIYANAEKNKGFYGYCDVYKTPQNVITVAGRGINLGIAHARDHKFYPIVRLLVLTPIKEQNIYFFEYQINNMNLLLESTGVPQLTAPQLSRYKIYFPSLPEQTKIANFLAAIDTKIDQLTKKQTLLKQYKKGVMQKLFSQELRFKADDGSEFSEWEEKKLWDICLIKKGSQLNRDGLDAVGQYAVINGGITSSGYSDKWNTEANSITISEGGNSCGYVNFITEKFWSGGHCYTLENIKNTVKNEYLFQYLKAYEIQIMRLRVGSGLPNIQKGEISKFNVKVPSLEEQTKIANFLTAIDTKIDLATKQLDATKQFKKALLQQMFV